MPTTYPALDLRREQVKSFVRCHFSNPDLSVDMIADRMQLSQRYVQLAFAAGTTPGEYIRQMRLNHAAGRLLEEVDREQSIAAIA